MKAPTLLAFTFLLAACGQEQVSTVNVVPEIARTVNEVAITTGTPVTMADLSIDGMTCEMGCGSMIKSALAKLPGVTDTEVKFTDADMSNHVVVTYDPAQVTDEEMVKAVQGIHDGQYRVMAVSITKQVVKEGASEAPQEAEAQTQVNAAAISDVVLPSLVELLGRLVRL